MNWKHPIKSALNLISSTATTATTPAPTLSPAAANVGTVSGAPAAESNDDFIRRFGGKDYWPNGAAEHRGLGFMVAMPPPLSEHLWRQVLERATKKGILSKDAREKLIKLKADQEAIRAKLNEVGFFSSSSMLRQFQAKGVQQLLAGQSPQIPGQNEVMSSIVALRRGLHDADREISKEIYAVVKLIEDAVRNAAREMAVELDRKERESHSRFYSDDFPFKPSPQLLALAYVGLCAAGAATRNFRLTGLLSAPDPDNLLAIWWNPGTTPPPVNTQRERDASRNEAHLSAVDRNRLAVVERSKAELADKNALVAKIKASSAKAIADSKDAAARKSAEDEQRKQQAFDNLQTK